MLEVLIAVQLLCSASVCTYDASGKVPVIVMLDCSLWKGSVDDIYKQDAKTVLIVKRVPCRRS